LRSVDYVKNKISNQKQNSYKVEISNSEYSQVLLIRYFEDIYKIDPLNIDNFSCIIPENIKESTLNNMKFDIMNRFRLKVNLNTIDDIKTTYLKIIKYMSGTLGIIKSSRTSDKGKRVRNLGYDCDKLKDIFDLVILKNMKCLANFDERIIKNVDKEYNTECETRYKMEKAKIETINEMIFEYMLNDDE
jgi:hypothetical protein